MLCTSTRQRWRIPFETSYRISVSQSYFTTLTASNFDLYKQLHEIGYFSDGKGGGVKPDCWDEVDDNWSALPDLNRSPVSDEAFALLRELSRQCMEDIRRGRTAPARQLLSMLAGVEE